MLFNSYEFILRFCQFAWECFSFWVNGSGCARDLVGS